MWGHAVHLQCASQEWAPNKNQVCQHLDLGLPASRTSRNNCLVFEPPVCGILSWQPRLTETLHHEPQAHQVAPGARGCRGMLPGQTPGENPPILWPVFQDMGDIRQGGVLTCLFPEEDG